MSGPRLESELTPSQQITQADVEHAKAQWRQDARGPMKQLLDAKIVKEATQ